MLCASSPARADDIHVPEGVCVDPRGCEPDSSGGSDAFTSGPPNIAWGKMTARAHERVQLCGTNPVCTIGRAALFYPLGLLFDSPVLITKGLVYGGYYGAKGVYYGARGIGHGVAATGRAVGRAVAYPFNRPAKPVPAPTNWEEYKHAVLKHQKKLGKVKANRETRDWCLTRVPLEVSPNRAAWEERCNGDGAVSRAALPAAPALTPGLSPTP
ncbi:hypothetical protein EPO15_13945 [bacterium]|nr:MAG: hypothetical protein EPO15_13945 [bacterium]